MARLTIVNGLHKGTRLGLVSTNVLIGRDPDCDLVLNQDWVSRRHCRLVRDEKGWLIEDLGSRNGVCVNGTPVNHRAYLRSTDLVAIGPLVLSFEADAEGSRAVDGPQSASGVSAATAPRADADREPAGPAATGPEQAADDIRIAMAPELRFTVALHAVLEPQQVISQGGKTSLRALARRGNLAADVPFDGRLSGRFGRVRFLTLDSYGIEGRAEYTLRAGLMLPEGRTRRRPRWAEVYIQYRVEHTVLIRRPTGASVLDRGSGEVQLGAPTRTVATMDSGSDPARTQSLVSWVNTAGTGQSDDVRYHGLVARLAELCHGCLIAGTPSAPAGTGVTEFLSQRCLEAAELYRAWYRKCWQEEARRHDSQLPIGELVYEFGPDSAPLGRPKATVAASVYRWA